MIGRQNLIGGRWTAGAPAPNINPSDTNDIIGEYDQASPEQAAMAVAAAREAFRAWSRGSVQARADLLQTIGAEIMARQDELADLLSREEGKTRREALGEVTRAAQIFGFFAGEAVRLNGEAGPSVRPGVDVQIDREAVGVVAVVTPWNFPIAIPAWKIAPALAFGNTVIWKPAELTPASAWALADIIQRAGAPPGVFNLLMGSGAILGDALTGAGVDAVSFTGSTGVGLGILSRAAARGMKVQLEMGGKNALVILDDADLDVAVQTALDGAFFATGQRCTASSRLIVQEGIHDRFVSVLRAAMRAQIVGDARASATTIGPVVDSRQLRRDEDYIGVGADEGGKLIEGGARLRGATDGFYLSPALITETTSRMRINQEEVFGPLASVIRVHDYEEAVAVTNDVPFGLCAGICTTALKYARAFRRDADVGMVMVNLPTAGVDYHVPFGGRKASSYGPREQGSYAREFYTAVKTTYTQAG